MKSSLKKINDCRVKILVEVEPEKVEHRFQEVLKEFQRNVRLPGFREGKAPMDMVERKFAKEVQEEVLKSLVPEAYHQSLATQKVSAVSTPSISDVKFERGQHLTFAAEFDRSPEVSIKNYKGIKLKRVSEAVTDEDLNKAVASLLESKAELTPLLQARPVQRGDFIVTDIEIWKDGAYTPGKKGVLLFVEPNEMDDFFDKVVGAQIDDVREISGGPTPGFKPHYKLWIRAIKEKKVPALDEEFIKGFGKATLEEFREAVRKDLGQYKRSESFEKMKIELFEKLLEKVSFSVPESLVDRQREHILEDARKHFTRMGVPDKFEEEKAHLEEDAAKRALDQVKLYFVLGRIAELEKIEPEEDEVQRRLESIARESQKPMEEVRHFFEEDLRQSMVEKKTIDFLIANAKFDEEGR